MCIVVITDARIDRNTSDVPTFVNMEAVFHVEN